MATPNTEILSELLRTTSVTTMELEQTMHTLGSVVAQVNITKSPQLPDDVVLFLGPTIAQSCVLRLEGARPAFSPKTIDRKLKL